MTRAIVVATLLTVSLSSVSAQTPAPAPGGAASAPQAPAPAQPSAATAPTPPANDGYTIDGRRDPFVPLLGDTGKKGAPAQVRADGVAGLVTDEVAVRGILQSQGRWVAMVAGPAGKVYTVRPGDRLADGTVRGITPQFVVILQQVDDPLSLEKQREVKKFLRGGENK
jgi:Tfp pilus assembly protein PilP